MERSEGEVDGEEGEWKEEGGRGVGEVEWREE